MGIAIFRVMTAFAILNVWGHPNLRAPGRFVSYVEFRQFFSFLVTFLLFCNKKILVEVFSEIFLKRNGKKKARVKSFAKNFLNKKYWREKPKIF